jgi:DNA invertase Pin-like site-specific DNA recombinase
LAPQCWKRSARYTQNFTGAGVLEDFEGRSSWEAFRIKAAGCPGQIGNNSLDRQIEDGREWYSREIAPLGIPLDETFTDSARSAYKGEHVGKKGDLGRFLAAIESGAVSKGSILIAENLDRVSRQGNKIARKLLEQIVDKGVDVHIVNIEKKLTMGWENRPNDYTIVDSELNRAYRESERKSKIIKAGLQAVKHTDDWAGNLPFWLQKVYEPGSVAIATGGKKSEKPKYKIEVIPEQAELVREIFRLSAQGLGAKSTMKALKAEGIKCSISLGTVGELLRNRAVLGEHQPMVYLDSGAVPDGDPVQKFPRIVDQTQFNMVAARLDGKLKVGADGKSRPATGSHNSGDAKNLFDGLLHDVTDQPERTLQFQCKGGFNNPYLISAWEPDRKANRVRYDLFEQDFLRYLKDDVNWKAVAGEKETEALKKARHDLNQVRAELDQARHLLARRSEQALNPDLTDEMVAVYNGQIAYAHAKIATLTEQEHRLESLISVESMRSAALETPEKLIAMITAGDPAMRLSLRTELQRMITRIDFDFAVEPDKITITVTFINDVQRTTKFRKPIRFTKPLRPSRSRRLQRTSS